MNWSIQLQATLGALKLDVDLTGNAQPLALIGPNGSGKTTLLRMFAGAHHPHQGRIEIGGRILFDQATGVNLPSEARRIGYLPQNRGLFPHLRVIDNVAFGLSGPRKAQREAARAMLASMGCEHLADRSPSQLSGGEAQRVALARATIVEPAMLLLDEPLAALDIVARRQMRGFIAQRLVKLGRPAIVVTHDIRDVQALDAMVCVLTAGRVIQYGSLASLIAEPASEFVAEFVGLAIDNS